MQRHSKTKYGIQKPVTAIVLNFRSWKNLFSEDYYKALVAEALNYCIYEDKTGSTVLIGYLLTSSDAYLVFNMNRETTRQAVSIFHEKLGREVRHEIERKKTKHLTAPEKEQLMEIDYNSAKLFEIHDLKDEDLIRLMTGQSVSLPYSSVRLQRMKDMLHHSRHCSVIDYSGAIGPVQVTLVKSKTEEGK